MTEKLKLYEFGTVHEVMGIFDENLVGDKARRKLVFSLISTLKVLEGRCKDKDLAYEQQAVELAKADSESMQYEVKWTEALDNNNKLLKKMETTKQSCCKLIDENAELKNYDKGRQQILEAHAERIMVLRDEIDKLEKSTTGIEVIKLCKENKELIAKCNNYAELDASIYVSTLKLQAEQKETEILRSSIKSAESALKYKEKVTQNLDGQVEVYKNALYCLLGPKNPIDDDIY